MRPPPLNLLGLASLARPPGWCQLPPTLGCPPGPGGVSTDLQAVLVETSKARQATGDGTGHRVGSELTGQWLCVKRLVAAGGMIRTCGWFPARRRGWAHLPEDDLKGPKF